MPLLAVSSLFAACPSAVAASAVPPRRQTDPQAVNLNEAESRAGPGRTRPYGSVADRGMRMGAGEKRGGGEKKKKKGARMKGCEERRKRGELTRQNGKERKGRNATGSGKKIKIKMMK